MVIHSIYSLEKVQNLQIQLQENREKHYREIQDLNDKYEDKLQNLSEAESENSKIPKENITPEFTKFFEKQAEENTRIRSKNYCSIKLLNLRF